ncbi:MAG: hypothetical protein ACXADC_17730 [Candidatus Thorarchaeota archaeon]
MTEDVEVQVINTLNGRRNVVTASDPMVTYGELIKSYSLAPPDVVWTILDTDGNDITDEPVGERQVVAHITPGQDIAGGT